MKPRTLAALGAAALVCLAAATWGLNHYLGRPDRIAAEARRVALFEVRDQVLRFEHEQGRLPDKLEQLVPKYLRREQVMDGVYPRYAYDAQARRLSEVHGPVVAGLWSYQVPPREADLPPTNGASTTGHFEGNFAQRIQNDPADLMPATPPRPPPPSHLHGDLLAGPAFGVPQNPKLPAPPHGMRVFEAEHFGETNYGWEVTRDASAAGGAYLHCKEGITNGPAQVRHMLGDFFNVKSSEAQTFLRIHFHLAQPGRYRAYGRIWTTDTKCSNSICASFDVSEPYAGTMSNRTPYRWCWTEIGNGPHRLEAGDHYLYLFIHEDGVRVDQFALTPEPLDEGQGAFEANLAVGEGTAFAAKARAPLAMLFDYDGMVFGPGQPPQVRVALRRLRKDAEALRLRVVLKGAAEKGGDFLACDGAIVPAQLPELGFLTLPFEKLDSERLARKEYLLQAELLRGEVVLDEIHTPLLRAFDWELFGPGKHIENGLLGPLDGDRIYHKPGDTRTWTLIDPKCWDPFGVLDFGLAFSGNSRHPMQYCAVYARTRIRVPEAGTYLFKIQSDDQMVLWLDGQEIYRTDQQAPVTRSGERLQVRMEAGEHRLRMRVNQAEGRWQASLRIRTKDDELSGVIGLPAPHETKR